MSYKCTICGYVLVGELGEQPDDYVCPVCGVSKEQFEKE